MLNDNSGYVTIDSNLVLNACKAYVREADKLQDQNVKASYLAEAYRWLSALELHTGPTVQLSISHKLIHYCTVVNKQTVQKVL